MRSTSASGRTNPHALYRFYDRSGVLIYVGITNNPGRRLSRHEKSKDWWWEVTEVRIERYPDRDSVLNAEVEAITNERPKYNIQHNGSRKDEDVAKPQQPSEPGQQAYPVKLDDAVALCLRDGECPVGLVTGLFEFGVKISLFMWLDGYFGREAVFRWDCIEEIHFAYKNNEDIYEMDDLGGQQTRWKKAHGKLKEEDPMDKEVLAAYKRGFRYKGRSGDAQ